MSIWKERKAIQDKVGLACLIFFSCFALAFICGSLSFIPKDSEAVNQNNTVDVNLVSAIALTLSPNQVNLPVTPTPLGTLIGFVPQLTPPAQSFPLPNFSPT
jgi:hypothetical protein